MNKLIVLISILTIVGFAGCKKKSSNTSTTPTMHFGTTYDDSSQVTNFYYYAPDRRIAGVHDNLGKYWTYYHYNGTQIEAKQTYYGLLVASMPTVVYMLGTNGFVDSSLEIEINNTAGIRKKYSYDGSGYLVNVKWFSSENKFILSENMSINNGNVVQHSYTPVDSSNQNLPRYTNGYDYYTDKNSTLGNAYSGQEFFGTSSKNTVKSWTYTVGGVTTRVNYTYNYDSNNYVTSQLVYRDSVGISVLPRLDSISFVYYQ